MDIWITLSKAALLVYCITYYIGVERQNYTETTLFILIYICLNISVYVLRGIRKQLTALITSAGMIVFVAYTLAPIYILLLPMNLYEIIGLYEGAAYLSIMAAALPLFLIGEPLWKEYLLVLIICLLFYTLAARAYKKIQQLHSEIDELRERNYRLNININKELEYGRQTKYMTQLEERNKISQEIHDHMGHTVAGSIMQLEAVKLLLRKDKDRAEQLIENIIEVLRVGMENIRATLRNIKPPSEQLGINRLKLLADEFQSNHNIKVNLIYTGDLDKVTYGQWKVIYDNTIEAMTNTLKYARASVITIKVEVLNKLIKSEVRDNGTGACKISKGLGLRGIEERSGNLGGKVIVDGSRGFSIIALFPIE
jgi:signal transduction histidine kinase